MYRGVSLHPPPDANNGSEGKTWRADCAQRPRKEKWRRPRGELTVHNNWERKNCGGHVASWMCTTTEKRKMAAAKWRADCAQQPRKEKWQRPSGELTVHNNREKKNDGGHVASWLCTTTEKRKMEMATWWAGFEQQWENKNGGCLVASWLSTIMRKDKMAAAMWRADCAQQRAK